MFSTFFQPCELKLHLLQNAIFLHPPDRPLPESHERPPMANDEIVRGLVELYVPSNRHISGIRVRLKAVQTIALLDPASGLTPISWEDSTVLEKVVEIGIQSDKEKNLANYHHSRLSFNNRSSSAGPALHTAPSSHTQPRGRSSATPDRSGRSGSAFGLRSHSPGGSIPASMARAVSRGRKIASGMGRISHSPSPSNSRSASRASSPSAPISSERGRTATRAPPTYAYAISEACQNGTASVPQDQEVVSVSLPPSQAATPQRSRRQSLSSQTPPDERGQQQSTQPDELADHLQRSLAVHAGSSDRRSASATPVEHGSSRSSALHPTLLVEEDRGKAKSRSSSIGFFGSRKARSKSRAPLSRGVAGLSSDLVQVEEEGDRGRRGAWDRPPLEPSGSSRSLSVTPGSEGEGGWETESTQDGLELQKGVHGFEFAFIIPCDAPPYERSPFGRVRYIIKATAIGAGRAKSNVECWRDLYPMVNPSPDSGPTPLTVLYNDLHPTVGLVSIACTSNNISVGGVFNIDVNSPTPPKDLIVYLVRVSLETTIELTTKRKGKQTVPVQRSKLFEKGWVPPKNNDGSHGDGKRTDGFVRNYGTEDAWTVQGIARMPDDNHIRASTVAASKASIRFSHVIVVEIVHSRRPAGSTAKTAEEEAKERRLKVFALRQPVLVPSCCCAYDAVTLPAYSAAPDPSSRRAEMPYDLSSFNHHPPNSDGSASAASAANASGSSTGGTGQNGIATAGPNAANTSTAVNGHSQLFCVCGMSLQDLSAQERALIPSAPLDVMRGELFRHQGKIGELPPRLENRRRSPSTSSSTSGIVASLRGRRRSTSSTRTASASATGGSPSGATGSSGERRPSITASIKGRSPSISSALRARRSSSSSTGYRGGAAFGRGESVSRGSAISRTSAASGAGLRTHSPMGRGGARAGTGIGGSSSTDSTASSSQGA
ncbi:Cyclin binding protein [Pseudozyma hubeiensis]|nr:Cyclin binding protein [Pseudozyma hubeiensis]